MAVHCNVSLFFGVAFYVSLSECARILGVFPIPTRSHYILGNKLLSELARRGHQVVMVSPFSQVPPQDNYKDIILEGISDGIQNKVSKQLYLQAARDHPLIRIMRLSNLGIINTIEALEHPNFQKQLKSDENFDLIIVEIFLIEALLGLSYFYNCPVIGMDSHGASSWSNALVGNPAPFSYSSNMYLDYVVPKNLYQRLANTLVDLTIEAYKQFVHLPRSNQILKTYFKGAPHLEEIMYNNISIILLNSQASISGAMPRVPALVNIGSFHIDEPKVLPTDLQDFLDQAKNGVILFSMGSILEGSHLPADKKDVILRSFAKLEQRILWKFDIQNLTNKPDNVKFVKWLPQNDVLAHKNVKLFITHGGILSITEAIYHGIPILGIPVFGDQPMNVDIAVNKGYGLRLELTDLTEETFSAAIQKLINNPNKNVKSRSKILRDQYIKPMDAAVFWTEYVIRQRSKTFAITSLSFTLVTIIPA